MIILVFAFILRLVNLNQSLWLDEAVQAITAQNSLGYIFQEITGDFHPPLYYFLMHFWVKLFGSSEVVLRLPSVLFGVGTVWLVWKISRLSNLSCLGTLFLATAPFHIYYSQEARMYAMVTFFTVLSIYFFMKINGIKNCPEKGIPPRSASWRIGRNDNIMYFISTILMIYSDYYGFLILLVQCVYLLIKKKYKFLFICLFAYLLIYVPWLPMFITQIKTGMLATRTLPEWARLVNVSFVKAIPLTLIKFSIGRITIFNKTLYGGITLIIGLLYGGLILKVLKGWLKEKLKDDRGTVILLWFFVPLIFAWIASLFVPNYQPFRLLLILPSFYLILAEGIEGLEKNRRVKEVVVAVVLLVNFVSLSVYYLNPYFHREDWRGVTKFLMQQKGVVILPSETSNWPIKYYDSEEKIRLTTVGKGVGEIGEIGKIGEDKVFYIRYLVPLFDPNEKILAELDVLGYTKVKEISFNQIPLWEFVQAKAR